MATLANIFGPQGMTGLMGSQGMTGPQGITGATGSVGVQGVKGNLYDYVMGRYKRQGLNMIYETDSIEIMIKDMDDSMIKNCMKTIKTGVQTEIGRAWFDIFVDVIVRRRKIKLEKIQSKMLCQ